MTSNEAKWGERRSGRSDKRPGDRRPEVERDRSRIVHSAAFRRLQGKTQVLGVAESDFHRTRLTHSMEVAQISRGIVYQLGANYARRLALVDALPDIALIEAVGFGHDLGHPPFGHGGEVALNYVMRSDGGFEGNGHSLRLLSRLENHTESNGLDLTRRALLGILKYPAPYSALRAATTPQAVDRPSQLRAREWKPPKCYLDTEVDVVEWILAPLSKQDRDHFTEVQSPKAEYEHGETRHKALDTSIMELADDIAYGVHDFEDGVGLGLIRRDHWTSALKALDTAWSKRFGIDSRSITADLFAPRRGQRSGRRKRAIGALVNAFVSSCTVLRQARFESPLLAFNVDIPDPARTFLDAITDLTREHVIRKQEVQMLEYRGRYVTMSLFEALQSDWKRLINIAFRRDAEERGDIPRSICVYIAGMTDAYAMKVFERLFLPREGSVFEPL